MWPGRSSLKTSYKILIKKTFSPRSFSTLDSPPLTPRQKKQVCYWHDEPISLLETADVPVVLWLPSTPRTRSTPADMRAPAVPRQSCCHLHSPCSWREPNPASACPLCCPQDPKELPQTQFQEANWPLSLACSVDIVG